MVNGTTHTADAVALAAQGDLVTAYNDAAGRPVAVDVSNQDLGGTTLTPGVYAASTAMALTGTVTLDAQSDPAAVFIFQAGSTLVTAANSRVQVINGASPCQVFWQVGSSATLGVATQFVGTILALTSATLGTAASVEGRVLARNGAVTLDTNVVTAPACAAVVPTVVPTPTVTPTATASSSPTPSATVSATPSATVSPTGTATPTTGVTPSTPGATAGTPIITATAPTGVASSATPVRPTPVLPGGGQPGGPVVPRGHPDTGLGGSQPTPVDRPPTSAALFVLAGVSAAASAATAAVGRRRTRRTS